MAKYQSPATMYWCESCKAYTIQMACKTFKHDKNRKLYYTDPADDSLRYYTRSRERICSKCADIVKRMPGMACLIEPRKVFVEMEQATFMRAKHRIKKYYDLSVSQDAIIKKQADKIAYLLNRIEKAKHQLDLANEALNV